MFDYERKLIPLNMIINEKGKIEIFYLGNNPEKLEEMREYLIAITSIKNS